ncbi:MAG TPA: hypothetical protein VEA99_01795 [Gemmatimonadaceae bacterium]|nr:hypothetical protein [Gemmatimonadaceae bacterium]
MHFDPRVLVGLIVVAGGTVMFALSYVAAYMLGRQRGRREAGQEAERLMSLQGDAHARARIDQVEQSIAAVASSVKRLGDAQRIWVDYQDRTARRERADPSRRTPA